MLQALSHVSAAACAGLHMVSAHGMQCSDAHVTRCSWEAHGSNCPSLQWEQHLSWILHMNSNVRRSHCYTVIHCIKLCHAGGWLHTGDQGFLDQEGYLTLTGRLKELINRGGEKISPIEASVQRHRLLPIRLPRLQVHGSAEMMRHTHGRVQP